MKDEILNLSNKLISIKSTADNQKGLNQVINLVRKYLETPNIIIKKIVVNNKPSIVGTYTNTKTPTIFLNGHVDVVPAKKFQFKPVIKGDKLIGRGSQDMKASCASMLYIFKKLSSDGSIPKNKLGIQIVTDEEIGGFDGTKALRDKGYIPKFLLAGESTNGDIEIGSKGVIWLEITIPGISTHSAYLWKGDNAIRKAVKSLSDIGDVYPVPTKEVWETTCNFSSIKSGNATNKVPESAVFKLDIRYIPTDNPDQIIKKVKKCLPRGSKVKIIELESALKTDPKNKSLLLLQKTATKILGKKSKLIKKHGASDARFYSEIGVPATNFGPVGEGLHSDDEWVSINSLIDQAKILESWIKNV